MVDGDVVGIDLVQPEPHPAGLWNFPEERQHVLAGAKLNITLLAFIALRGVEPKPTKARLG